MKITYKILKKDIFKQTFKYTHLNLDSFLFDGFKIYNENFGSKKHCSMHLYVRFQSVYLCEFSKTFLLPLKQCIVGAGERKNSLRINRTIRKYADD
jgi:hypothetical protein